MLLTYIIVEIIGREIMLSIGRFEGILFGTLSLKRVVVPSRGSEKKIASRCRVARAFTRGMLVNVYMAGNSLKKTPIVFIVTPFLDFSRPV
jgi:hypothetical protein